MASEIRNLMNPSEILCDIDY